MHYAASHHKLDIGNAFWSVSCNIPDCRAHRVHELLMNNYIDDIPRLWEQRKNKILFMDQVFNTTCIMIKWWRQTLSKSVMIAMAGAIPELVASRSSRRRRSLQSQDQITKWNWDENPLFSRRKFLTEQTCCWNRCPKVPQDFPCRCSSRLALACCAWARQHFLPNLWNIVVRDKKDN